MRGSANYQANEIIKAINGIGQSKRQNKTEAHLRGGLKTSPLIHSFRTMNEIKSRAIDIYNYISETKGGKVDMQSLTDDDIKGYIQSKIDLGLKKRSIDTYISQIEKIRYSLDSMDKKLDNHYNLFSRDTLVECKELAKGAEKSTHKNRALSKPLEMLENIKNPIARISAELQLRYGLRVNESIRITENHIKGDMIEVRGKGGYYIVKAIDKELMDKIKLAIQENGKMQISLTHYKNNLRQACEDSNQRYYGTHALRYNYAQNKYVELIKNGIEPKEAQRLVSEELGHHRPDITLHYLRA